MIHPDESLPLQHPCLHHPCHSSEEFSVSHKHFKSFEIITDQIMNILQVAVLFATTLKCVTASNVTSSEPEEGAKRQQPQVTGTVSTSSTMETGLIPLPQPQASSSGQLVPRTRENALNPYQELMARGNYEGIAKLGKMTESNFVVNLCPLMTTVEHYNSLHEFMKDNKLIPSFLVNGNIELVRKVISKEGVQFGNFCFDVNLSDALVSSFKQEDHGRFIGILTAGEHQHMKSGAQEKWKFSNRFSISRFYKAIEPKDNTKFKHFLVRHGEELNSEYPISYKFLCEQLVFHFYFEEQDSTLKDFLGQPFPFPPEAIVDGFLIGSPLDSRFQRFLNVAPREAIEQGVIGSDEYTGRRLWENIVERFPDTDPTFPPSNETLKNVLANFPTKEGLEEAWSKENAHRFKGKVSKRSMEMRTLILPLDLLLSDLVNMVIGYTIPPRFSWLDLEE